MNRIIVNDYRNEGVMTEGTDLARELKRGPKVFTMARAPRASLLGRRVCWSYFHRGIVESQRAEQAQFSGFLLMIVKPGMAFCTHGYPIGFIQQQLPSAPLVIVALGCWYSNPREPQVHLAPFVLRQSEPNG